MKSENWSGKCCALLVCAVVFACDDPSVPEEAFGTYTLVTIDNSTLPAIAGVNQQEQCSTLVQSGTLTIAADETFDLVINGTRTACNTGTPAGPVTLTLDSEWLQLRGDSLVFDPVDTTLSGCNDFGIRPVARLGQNHNDAVLELGFCTPVTLKQYRFEK